jgi:hypothetical protein
MQVFPADSYDVEPMLDELESSGLIIRYTVDSKRYISIPKWHKHQSPHVKERESEIPAPEKHGESTIQAPENPERAALIPDSGFLIPDSSATDRAPYPPDLNAKAWQEYLDYRREAGFKKLTEKGETMAMNRLLKISKAAQQECVDNTIANGWQGLFPDKTSGSVKQKELGVCPDPW